MEVINIGRPCLQVSESGQCGLNSKQLKKPWEETSANRAGLRWILFRNVFLELFCVYVPAHAQLSMDISYDWSESLEPVTCMPNWETVPKHKRTGNWPQPRDLIKYALKKIKILQPQWLSVLPFLRCGCGWQLSYCFARCILPVLVQSHISLDSLKFIP